MRGEHPWWRSPSVMGGIAAAFFTVIFDTVLRHTSGSALPFTLFLGRFHPLAVHLPIGILLLVGAAEAASLSPRFRARVDPAIGLGLPVLLLASVAALVLGHLLARAGGFPARTLVIHRRLELFAVVGVAFSTVAWSYQSARDTPRARALYRGVLGLTLVLLSVGAHFGGTMTRGDSYLTRYAPAFLRPLLGGAPVPAQKTKAAPAPSAGAEPLLFENAVVPILNARCVSCHGAEKHKGELRLDSLAAIRTGGEDGAVLVPGSAEKSPLFARTVLPLDDDDHMPPVDEPAPTPAELAVLRFWIERGASDTLRVRDALPPPEARGVLEKSLGATPTRGPIPSQVTPPKATPAESASAPRATPKAAPTVEAPPVDAVAPGATTEAPTTLEPSSNAASLGSATAILAARCARCHGAKKQKGKLRLDSLEALLTGGKHGPAIVPGRPSESLFITRVRLPLGDEAHMPPKKEAQLTPAEISALASFVAALEKSPQKASEPSSARRDEREPTASAPTESAPSTGANAGATPPVTSETVEAPDASTPDPALLARLPPQVDLFAEGVQPLLHERCQKCHGGKSPAAGLSVQDRQTLVAGGTSGPAIVPGNLEKSLLWARVSLPIEDGDHMPPEGETQLGADDLALIRSFIATDPGEHGVVTTATLPAAAVRSLAAHHSAQPEPAPAPPPKGGGCAACAVGAGHSSGLLAGGLGLAVLAAFGLRRNWRASRR